MKVFVTFLLTLLIGFVLFVTFTPMGRAMMNEYGFMMERVDEEIDYDNRKMVEDTARSMIATHDAAFMEYETYRTFCEKETYDENKCERALSARTSANKTASTYNNYMLKNKYLFKGNMPFDIFYELPFIED